MKLGYTLIYAHDVLTTVDFYQNTFSLTLKFVHESHQYAEMNTGETTLAFASEALIHSNGIEFKLNRSHETPAGFEIAFVTYDIHAAFETAVKAGAKPISAPTEKPWGVLSLRKIRKSKNDI